LVGVQPDWTAVPEKQFQPRLAPRLRAAGRKVISSFLPPTSPMYMSPVWRSNDQRYGLRIPDAYTSGWT
jgi:hypothetical protein